MAIQKLAKAGALGTGADLWIIPSPEQSSWARKIDWYLNFQIARAQQRSQPQVSTEITDILTTNEIVLEFQPRAHKSLLVVTQDQIPVGQVLCLPFSGTAKDWLETAKRIWEDLGRLRVRLFVPIEIKEVEIFKHWPEEPAGLDLSFVPGDIEIDN